MVGDGSSDVPDFTLRALGPATEGGRLPLAELARLVGGLQAALEILALSIAGKTPRAGRRPRDIVNAVKLDFVGFHAGSAVLNIARTGQLALDGGLLDQSLRALEDGIPQLQERPQALPQFFTPPLVNVLRSLTGGIAAKNVTAIELERGGRVRFVMDDALKAALRDAPMSPVAQESTIVGRLHMGDFSPGTLQCRVDTYAGSVLCDFDSGLRDAVLDAMDEMVMAEGIAEVEPNGHTIRILHLTSLRPLETARPRSIEDLAREQGVTPLRSTDELRGAPVDGMEEFVAALRLARGEGE